jgi:hypothetical protein
VLISQIQDKDGRTVVVARELDGNAWSVANAIDIRTLALEAARLGLPLRAVIESHGVERTIDIRAVKDERRFLPPITHPDPAHLHISGTGLTHLGSAAVRDAMHQNADAPDNALTDSMRMFRLGLAQGRPEPGRIGVQPEWFYKGNGTQAVAAEQPLTAPAFALDAGEEPELAGIYVIGEDGMPLRVGFSLANEFSDHVMERINYLYLAHSKLRQASFGPEILLGPAPQDVRGISRIRRGSEVIFEKAFLSGEANMSHTFANLEHHHFKYAMFRQPGDVHVHLFGTATLSFADGIKPLAGDVFEIEAPEFGLPLRNPLKIAPEERISVRVL